MEEYVWMITSMCVDHFVSLLQQCIKRKAVRPCKQVHSMLLTSGVDMNIMSLNSRLVGVYASSGDLRSAQLLFQQTPNPNVFAINWMVSAMAFNGFHQQAIGYFSLMNQTTNIPNTYTFSLLLKAIVGLLHLKMGKEVHAVVTKMPQSDVSLANAFIDMYFKCGDIGYARQVFDNILKRDVVSWTSMISGYFSAGKIGQSLVLFERMKLEGLEPNAFTWNAMIAGYARAGDCDRAFTLFSTMPRQELGPDLATWNAMISGLVQSQRTLQALDLFRHMLIAGIMPNEVTVTGLLPACGLMGSIQRGKEIHGLIYRMGLYINVFVASALIDMYSKCASVKDASNVFDNIPIKNVSSWNAMIGCYGKNGIVESAIDLFERMENEQIRANEVTLICVLSACSHGGLVAKGLGIFRSMRERYGIEVSNEHCACVIDLLCRSGKMEEAYNLLKEVRTELPESVVGAFFNGCKLHKRRDLAKQMAEDNLRMEMKRPGGFVTLSNIYAAEEDWEEVQKVRKGMKERGVYKQPGFSWVDKRNEFAELELGKDANDIKIGAENTLNSRSLRNI